MLKIREKVKIEPEWLAKPYRIGKAATGRTVLVIGALSDVGRKVCRKLIDRGDRLIVLVADKKKAADVFGPHAMVISNVETIGHGTTIDRVLNVAG